MSPLAAGDAKPRRSPHHPTLPLSRPATKANAYLLKSEGQVKLQRNQGIESGCVFLTVAATRQSWQTTVQSDTCGRASKQAFQHLALGVVASTTLFIALLCPPLPARRSSKAQEGCNPSLRQLHGHANCTAPASTKDLPQLQKPALRIPPKAPSSWQSASLHFSPLAPHILAYPALAPHL